ncbi:DUF1203 domain-containing protein [Pseudovibrio exalbescens]|uniref:DUF1203 domain-containing protein n=1 Tax=Pseudovibrio exalbescens TaxID=197461 RepID=UPI002366C136|nr:DUF1203 domain-containing protein [Pseudovibrio exalbescens]MDD7911712.1 DUF1203 domain-containing protein [Pseudovibrio exalbescens]
MSFVITGLNSEEFSELNGLGAEALAARNVVVYEADAKPGFPCRVSLADAEVGERVFLLNYTYQPHETPYRASHAIFVRENAPEAPPYIGTIPLSLSSRLLSLRGFDKAHMMIEADIAEGEEVKPMLERFFANPEVNYVQLHYARRGCFAAAAHRA